MDGFDAPEVDGAADVEVIRIAAAAAHAGATEQKIEKTTQVPEPVAVLPAVLPPRRSIAWKAISGGKGVRRERESTMRRPYFGAPDLAVAVRKEENASDQRVSANWRSSLTSARVRAWRKPKDGPKNFGRGVIVDDGFVAQAVDKLAADSGVDRSDEAEPEAGEPRRKNWDRDHPAFELALARVFLHQFEVADLVGAADFENAAGGDRKGQGLDQVGDDVFDGDGLGASVDPAGSDHHRKFFDQGADISKEALPEPMTMEARSSMVCTPHWRRRLPTSWRLRRCAGYSRAVTQAAEVDDAFYAGGAGGGGESVGGAAVFFLEEFLEPMAWTR